MSALGYNPVHCIDCNLEVAPESLDLSEQLAEELAFWDRLYDAIDHLWLDSAEYEEWARNQLCNIKSAVNNRGLILQNKLNKVRRCYFWFFEDTEAEPLFYCPKCNAQFSVYPKGIFPQFICEQCSIVTVGE